MVPAVVLLRGLAREQRHWGGFAPLLSKELAQPVLCQDLPGMGEYHTQQSPHQMAALAAVLGQRLSARHHGPWHLVAMSLGAMLALELARQYPAQVRSLVLINTSVAGLLPFYRRLRWQQYPAVFAALCGPVRLREQLILNMTSNHPARRSEQLEPSLRFAQQYPPSRLNALRQLWAASRFQLPECPACPILLVCSAQDRLVDPANSYLLADRWQLPLRSHSWAGHDLALDDPGWLVNEISVFYQSLDAENAASSNCR